MKEINIPVSKLLALVVIAIIGISIAFAGGYIAKGLSEKESVTFIDDYGRMIELPANPERIISTAPAPTEILFAVGAGDLVVGVDDYSNYPEEAANITKIGSFVLNIEAIVGLKPDLIVSSDLVPLAQLESIKEKGIPYMILATRTLDDVLRDITLIGSITGHSEEASALTTSMKARIDAIEEATHAEGVRHPEIYLEYFPMWTFGPGSFGQDLIELAGGVNIAQNASAEYLSLTDEYIIAKDPEIIIYTVGVMTTATAEDIRTRPAWDQIDAVRNNRIYSVDDNLISIYGPRIVDGLEALAKIIHPEIFQ